MRRATYAAARLALAALLLAPAIHASRAHAAGASAPVTWEEIAQARRAHDFFALRDHLARGAASDLPGRVAAAFIANAFNRPADSNAAIGRLRHEPGIPDSMRAALGLLAIENHRRLFHYADALAAAREAVADSADLRPSELQDARHNVTLFAPLIHVAPQQLVRRGATEIPVDHGFMRVRVNGRPHAFGLDTGANLSTVMRSVADSLAMRVLPAGVDVGSSTDRRVSADLAVADRLEIGALEFRNVLFLVLDDSLLTFGDFRIPGLVGFPVIEAMGEVRLHGRTKISVPASPSRLTARNLALDGLTLLTPITWEGERLLCRLDTGADRTQLYEPTYRRLTARIDGRSRAVTRTMGGAGGLRQLPVRVLGETRLGACDTTVVLDSLDVVVRSLAQNEDENVLDGNLGHDVFDRFGSLIVNFRDMAVLLRGRSAVAIRPR